MSEEMMQTSPFECPAWFDGKKINETVFCEEFLRDYPMVTVNDAFFTVNGRVHDENRLKKVIYDRIKYYVTSGIAKKVTSLLDVMRHDYIRTARAKGLRQIPVILRHALKNALLPVVTVMALQIAFLLSGSVITESIFNIPGVGRIAVGAIQNRDMPLLQGAVLFTTVLVILGNLAADLLYGWLDPRIRYE